MNASQLPEDAPGAEPPRFETVPGPVVRESIERRWLGIPARFVLLCFGFAALGASIGLLATGSWAWGIVMLLLAVLMLAGLAEALRRQSGVWAQHSPRLAAEGRSHAATTAEVWRTRLETALGRWRTRSRLDAIAVERGPALRSLGDAVWRGDSGAQREARQRLAGLEQERKSLENELAEQLARADERIRRARLPVQQTVMVAPAEPNAPYPPPGEADPPQPAQVPEPYPPPDEGTPPAPAEDPGQADE